MIGRVRGHLVAIDADRVLLDVGGLGYEIHVSPKTAAGVGHVGDEATLSTHLHVRDDALVLYGFATPTDRDLFRVLLGAQGVGPRVALGILGVFSADALRRVVTSEDVDSLTQVPGIGTRTAQRIILDLKPRLTDLEADIAESTGGHVRQALEQLGYSGAEIRDALATVDPDAPVAEQIRSALQVLGKKR